MDREPEIKAILQKACDRDWKDETLYQTAVIASNAIYWRDREIELLKKRCSEAEQRERVMGAIYEWIKTDKAQVGPARMLVGNNFDMLGDMIVAALSSTKENG
jgi:hypothetical protein